jgi:hypothetical protein
MQIPIAELLINCWDGVNETALTSAHAYHSGHTHCSIFTSEIDCQGVINALMLMRMLKGPSGTLLNDKTIWAIGEERVNLDGTMRNYFGNSLGGILGTLCVHHISFDCAFSYFLNFSALGVVFCQTQTNLHFNGY